MPEGSYTPLSFSLHKPIILFSVSVNLSSDSVYGKAKGSKWKIGVTKD